MIAAIAALLLAAAPDLSDAPAADAEDYHSRILKRSVALADGDHDIWILKMYAGESLPELATDARLVPIDSWIVLGREFAEDKIQIEQLQAKPDWWLVGAVAGIGIALGIGAALLLVH